MIPVRPEDVLHKTMLLRLLSEILDDALLGNALRFKGGTCASMAGWLDRFSVDLDFDLVGQGEKNRLRQRFHEIFRHLGMSVKDESHKALEFFVRYPAPQYQRNTIKVDALDLPVRANTYAPVYLAEIDRTAVCQTRETIFANKLVALTDREKKSGAIAGRDVYDIHHFFLSGFRYNQEVIRERTEQSVHEYFRFLHSFIREKVTVTVIDQDLNTLLPLEKFHRIRKTLKHEVLLFLHQELTGSS